MQGLRRLAVLAVVVAGIAVLRSRLLDADDERTGFGKK
jgi:hypothetical protein